MSTDLRTSIDLRTRSVSTVEGEAPARALARAGRDPLCVGTGARPATGCGWWF